MQVWFQNQRAKQKKLQKKHQQQRILQEQWVANQSAFYNNQINANPYLNSTYPTFDPNTQATNLLGSYTNNYSFKKITQKIFKKNSSFLYFFELVLLYLSQYNTNNQLLSPKQDQNSTATVPNTVALVQAYNTDLQTQFNPEYNYYNQVPNVNTSFDPTVTVSQNGNLVNNSDLSSNVGQVQINQMNYPVYNNYNYNPAVPAVYATNYNTTTTSSVDPITTNAATIDPGVTGVNSVNQALPVTTYIANSIEPTENQTNEANPKNNDSL